MFQNPVTSKLQALRAPLPVVVLLAVDAAVLAEAGELRLQVEFALTALEAPHVPLFVHGQQVVAVRDLPAAARAQSHALAGHTRHGLQGHHGKRHEDTEEVEKYVKTSVHEAWHEASIKQEITKHWKVNHIRWVHRATYENSSYNSELISFQSL